jgi:hypothetical protein
VAESERVMIGHSRLTRHTLGTAAEKILTGDATGDIIDNLIDECAWCQERRSNRECWHHAAKVLLDNGLRHESGTRPW